ncbi:hypothetical protein [Kitasatospora cheerisanensis]|uniref:hypothetical protein n=1 Tax=Kitasatospora cheerisanensis TaxID=81942 RepID=UPI00055AE69B|nr:hypothetical protein [Kitasatospora cheerisanensis]
MISLPNPHRRTVIDQMVLGTTDAGTTNTMIDALLSAHERRAGAAAAGRVLALQVREPGPHADPPGN